VQIYTGLIYRGPRLIQEACAVLANKTLPELPHVNWRTERS
jgi:dihydroorotate dehydrogenase